MREIIRQKIVDSLAEPVPGMTRRDVHVPRIKDKAVAVVGMRRSGKTTFLRQLLSDRLARAVPREALLYFNFEDERLAGMATRDLQVLVEEYYRLHPERRGRGETTFFLDEIQVVPEWEKFARRLMDTERIELFLSGSSARLLSREVATSMRGRAMEALVHPFSFREFLRHRGVEPAPRSRRTKAVRSELDRLLRTYLAEGGFPEAQGIEARDRFELLAGYVDAAILRDVVERHAVSNPTALRWMTRQLLSNAGAPFSVQKFYRALRSQGVTVAKDTLHHYLSHLEDAFLVRAIPVAADSERRRQVNPRKAYPIDPGLIPVFERSGKRNLGHALETAVMLELERAGCEVTYVRNPSGSEVDFLARRPGGEAELIQVSAEIDDAETLERELCAIREASQTYPKAGQRLLTMTPEAAGTGAVPGIAVISAVDWLLDSESRGE